MKITFSIVSALELDALEKFIKSEENTHYDFEKNSAENIVTILPGEDGVKVNKIANTTFEVGVEINGGKSMEAKPDNPGYYVLKVLECVGAFKD